MLCFLYIVCVENIQHPFLLWISMFVSPCDLMQIWYILEVPEMFLKFLMWSTIAPQEFCRFEAKCAVKTEAQILRQFICEGENISSLPLIVHCLWVSQMRWKWRCSVLCMHRKYCISLSLVNKYDEPVLEIYSMLGL